MMVFIITCLILVLTTSIAAESTNNTKSYLKNENDGYIVHRLKQRSTDTEYRKVAIQLFMVSACAVWVIFLNIVFCFKYDRQKRIVKDIERNITLVKSKELSSYSVNKSLVYLDDSKFEADMDDQQDSISSTGIQSTDSILRTLRTGPFKAFSRKESRSKDGYVSLTARCSDDDEDEWCPAFSLRSLLKEENGPNASLQNIKPDNTSQSIKRHAVKMNSSTSLESFFDSRRTSEKITSPGVSRSPGLLQTERRGHSLKEKQVTFAADVSTIIYGQEKDRNPKKSAWKSAWKKVKKKCKSSNRLKKSHERISDERIGCETKQKDKNP